MSRESERVQPALQPELKRSDPQPAAAASDDPARAMLRLQGAAGNGAVANLLHDRRQGRRESAPALLSSRLDADLSRVALHRGLLADRVTGQADALALTVGSDIFLANDAPAAHTPAGRHVLAHELVHVAQGQNGSAPAATGALEAEAAVGAAQMAGGERVRAGLAAPAGAPLALSRGQRTGLGIGLGVLGGLALGAGIIGLVALGGGALTAGLIGGLLGGGAALGGLIGGLAGGLSRGSTETEAAPAQQGMTAAQAAALTRDTPWDELVRAARDLRRANEMDAAARIYQLAILQTVAAMPFPKGLERIEPAMADIRVDFSLQPTTPFSDSADATTSPLAVEDAPDNYWRWMTFGPGAIDDTQAGTESVIFHELIHVRQFVGYWESFQAAGGGQSWRDYMNNMAGGAAAQALIAREELQAHLSILNYVERLSGSEARTGLRALFVYYAEADTTVLPAGIAAPATPADARAPILAAFNAAGDALKDTMGAQLWWAMLRVDPPADAWRRVFSDLRPIAERGYADPTFQSHYDALLRHKNLTYAELMGGGE